MKTDETTNTTLAASAWECPRCHTVNEAWVAFCRCGPYVETVTASAYKIVFREHIFTEGELWDRLSDEALALTDD